jgi:hypothetical protein
MTAATKAGATGKAGAAAKTAKAASASAVEKPRTYVAISDAGKYESRSMVYTMSDEEREQRSAQLVQLAMNEIRAFASKRNAPPLAKTARITDYQLRAFDLDLSNTPTFILSAKLPVPGKTTVRGGEFDYFVTVVARIDINGMPQKIFSSVTDSSYLDVFPQMELIDAVDADKNGRGDLLFRQYSDGSISYGLYRIFPYQMEKVFEGGSSL